MKVKYFQDTDTLYIELRATEIVETQELNENVLLDLDEEGKVCAITVEHATQRAELSKFTYEQINMCI